jgi:hypothetical protein
LLSFHSDLMELLSFHSDLMELHSVLYIIRKRHVAYRYSAV